MPELPEGRTCTIKEREFTFSIATTAVDLMRGLAGATSLEDYDGMLFDFGCPFSPIMTPKGLTFPVDLAFIHVTGKIVEIHRLDPNYEFPQDTVRRDVQYALEVPVGFFEDNDIQIGDMLKL